VILTPLNRGYYEYMAMWSYEISLLVLKKNYFIMAIWNAYMYMQNASTSDISQPNLIAGPTLHYTYLSLKKLPTPPRNT